MQAVWKARWGMPLERSPTNVTVSATIV